MAEYVIPTSFKDGDKVTIFDIDRKLQIEGYFFKTDIGYCSRCCFSDSNCKTKKDLFCNAVNCDGGFFVENKEEYDKLKKLNKNEFMLEIMKK